MSLKSKMQEILEDKITFKLQVEEQKERLSMLVVENQTLKDKVQGMDQELKQTRLSLKGAKTDSKALEDKTASCDKLRGDVARLEQLVQARETENAEQRQVLRSLQLALQQASSDHEMALKSQEGLITDLQGQLRQL